MKPIDVQNNALLALRRGDEATPNRLTTNLRAGGVVVNLHQVSRALERLRADGLVAISGEEHVMGVASRPIYSLTSAGRAEAAQLPEGERA